MSSEEYKPILSKSVAKICQHKNFNSCEISALDSLTNVAEFCKLKINYIKTKILIYYFRFGTFNIFN
jgi:hypothetical protein